MITDPHDKHDRHDRHDPSHEHIAKLKDVTLLLDLTRGELEVPHLTPVAPCDSLLTGSPASSDA